MSRPLLRRVHAALAGSSVKVHPPGVCQDGVIIFAHGPRYGANASAAGLLLRRAGLKVYVSRSHGYVHVG
jgi:hypothetical protein